MKDPSLVGCEVGAHGRNLPARGSTHARGRGAACRRFWAHGDTNTQWGRRAASPAHGAGVVWVVLAALVLHLPEQPLHAAALIKGKRPDPVGAYQLVHLVSGAEAARGIAHGRCKP